jgi:hypothetical protein
VVEACRDYAFEKYIILKSHLPASRKIEFARSEFPLIFSIENHCSVEQQDRMAEILVSTLGPLLHTGEPEQEAATLPSPAILQRKILIKAKRQPVDTEEEDEAEDEDDERDEKKKKKQVKLTSQSHVFKVIASPESVQETL